MSDVATWQKWLWPLLVPLGGLYGLIMRARQGFYDLGIFSSHRAQAPTVSVGNIGWGGTGKTPLCSWLLGWAGERSLSAALLTRGYRATPPELPFLVTSDADPALAGDEPLMLARLHPEAVVVVDPVRKRSAPWVEANRRPGLIVLDDGFQHRAMARDMELVLLKPEDLTCGWNRIIPAGSWRQGAWALKRAHAFFLKISPQGFDELAPAIEQRLGRMGKPVFSFTIEPKRLVRLTDNAPLPGFGGEPYLLVSGVGDPVQVEDTATDFLGIPPVHHLSFADHHMFAPADAARIEAAARRFSCPNILCTPKDAVKLASLASGRFHTLDLGLSFGPSLFADQPFPEWWTGHFERLRVDRA